LLRIYEEERPWPVGSNRGRKKKPKGGKLRTTRYELTKVRAKRGGGEWYFTKKKPHGGREMERQEKGLSQRSSEKEGVSPVEAF